MSKIYYLTAMLLIACLMTLAPISIAAATQSQSLTYESRLGQYQYCRADTQNNVRLTNQISGSSCEKDYSWGYDSRGIWVDRGCRADFQFGGGGNHTTRNTAIAAGIIGAVLIGAAVASSKSKNNNDGNDSEKRQYYRDGYRIGQQDWDANVPANYPTHRNRYNAQYESDWASGYDDGYNSRPKKY